jgi:CxxC-x17-CxxC domain-containing protein
VSNFETKILKCVECSNDFAFTAGEQEYFAARGLRHEPKRCQPCRKARSQVRGDQPGARGPKVTVWTVVRCSDCGGEARVPFRPTQGRAVYCSDCFNARTQVLGRTDVQR